MKRIFQKKSLGQNFLKCGWATKAVVGAATLTEHDTVLEIGPGKGVLTAALLEKTKLVIAVEKDDRLIAFLEEKFHQETIDKKLIIVHGDIIEEDILEKVFFLLEKNASYKLVANIPYYITGQLLRLFLSADLQPEKMVVMLQKEVAKRIVASDKKESLLSLSVKAYGTPKKIIDVPRSCFSPAPNVDSAILEISTISKDFFTDFSEENFFMVIKAGFAQKRKLLINNLSSVIDKEKLLPFLKNKVGEKARAEEIGLQDWKEIVKII